MMTALAPLNCVSPALLCGNETRKNTLYRRQEGMTGCVFCVLLESQK